MSDFWFWTVMVVIVVVCISVLGFAVFAIIYTDIPKDGVVLRVMDDGVMVEADYFGIVKADDPFGVKEGDHVVIDCDASFGPDVYTIVEVK